MRSGGTIIGFLFNADVVQLPINDINELVANLKTINSVQIYYGGSERSSNVLKSFRTALSLPRSPRFVSQGKLAIKLGLLSARAWLGNTFVARLSEPHQIDPFATSLTIEIRMPEFERGTTAGSRAPRPTQSTSNSTVGRTPIGTTTNTIDFCGDIFQFPRSSLRRSRPYLPALVCCYLAMFHSCHCMAVHPWRPDVGRHWRLCHFADVHPCSCLCRYNLSLHRTIANRASASPRRTWADQPARQII